MGFEESEKLKSEYTDKHVVVVDGVAELRRFSGLTGIVKTVNMSGRALVEFAGPADIGWYDIAPSYLKVVEAPVTQETGTRKDVGQSAAVVTAKPRKGDSPLELARQQDAAQASGSSPPDAPSKTRDRKLSPLELARQQGAAGKTEADSQSPRSAPQKSAERSDTSESSASAVLSPLDVARNQGAFREETTSAAPEETPISKPDSKAEESPTAVSDVDELPTTGPDGTPLSIPELARLQGPFKS